MDTLNLHKVDLNLLVALQALLEERSVSRAAERLGWRADVRVPEIARRLVAARRPTAPIRRAA